MTMGEIIGRFSDEAVAAEALLGLADLSLVAKVGAMAERFEETPADYVAGAVRRFARAAEGEDWLALMTALEKADDPGMAALRGMLVWSLREDGKPPASGGCGCGSAAHECAQ